MSEPELVRPVVVASKCLGFAACRYDGKIVADDFVARLQKFAEICPVCPELEIGLGVPRAKIRLIESDEPPQNSCANGDGAGHPNAGSLRLVQPATGRDLTDIMTAFARRYLAALETRGGVDGFILKSRSPSCGISNTKIFKNSETEEFSHMLSGVFAGAVKATFPDLALEDENQLADRSVRHRFLTRIFERARVRVDGLGDGGSRVPGRNAYPPELL